MADLDRSKLDKLRAQREPLDYKISAEQDRLRALFNKQGVFSREFSWLKIFTKWENTRPNADPIRYTGDGTYGLHNALARAVNDLAYPRPDPHSRALKVEIYFDPGRNQKHDLWKEEDRAKMVLIATIEPPA